MASRDGKPETAGADAAGGPLILGFEEWVALPELGLPAIRAKIDTGAKTSALHANAIEPFGPAAAPMVRFVVHPVPRHPGVEIACAAPLVDRREVISSNGDRELRYVIASAVRVGRSSWPIEITLTNRAAMTYRMLLGRQAMPDGVLIDPGHSFRQPRLGYRVYRTATRPSAHGDATTATASPRVIALVGRALDGPTAAALRQAVIEAGHRPLMIDPARARLDAAGEAAQVTVDGHALVMPDAALPVAGAMTRAADIALWGRLQEAGVATLVGADDLAQVADRPRLSQRLMTEGFAVGCGMLQPRGGRNRDEPQRPACSVLVLDGHATVSRRAADTGLAVSAVPLAGRIARVLSIPVLQIDFATGAAGPEVVAVSACPSLVRFGAGGRREASTLVRLLEQHIADRV